MFRYSEHVLSSFQHHPEIMTALPADLIQHLDDGDITLLEYMESGRLKNFTQRSLYKDTIPSARMYWQIFLCCENCALEPKSL